MEVALLLKLAPQLIAAGFRIADMIEKANDISDDDKAAMKAEIEKAKEAVTYWVDDIPIEKPPIEPDPAITPFPEPAITPHP